MSRRVATRGVVGVVVLAAVIWAVAWGLSLDEHLGRFLCRHVKRGWLEASGLIACWPE